MKKRILYIILLLTFTSCKNDKNIIFSYENIFVYSYLDKDSITQIVCYDTNKKVRDTFGVGYKGSVSEIILKDLNKDKKNDVLVVFDYSDVVPMFRYQAYFTEKNQKLSKPKINFRNKSIDFFTANTDELINHNLKIINDSTFMFQSGYNTVQIYELKNNTFIPIFQFIRENETDIIKEWKTKNNTWNDLTTKKDNEVKNNYLKLFEKSIEKSFVGQ
ncbi:hypothetical protein [Flavobacterium sp.]|uniref:hypothetical protein n=1 Tax=Flavobacterium sp. TaxID=239 RepID=UPI00260F1A33|nr:hypothetical protein [Flavobacterium sp.]MDD3005441.1 hypothetical protein [Flavobacterium sp.]